MVYPKPDKPKTLPEALRLPQLEGLRLSDLLGAPTFTPQPPIIQDRWFKDTTLYIDGYVFERCRFDQCNLGTELATFAFRECFLAPDTRIYFKGPSLKIARLLTHFLRIQGRIQMARGEEGIYATINHDGTFSLE